MKSRFVGTLAVALTPLGVFAGTAGANGNHGISGESSVTSIYQSGGLGTCQAASVAAGYQANSAPVRYYPGWFDCGQPE
jgi:hypothetical protein